MPLHSFQTAAKTYDSSARIQHQTASMIIQHSVAKTPLKILDIGCGTGILTQKVSKKFPHSEIHAIDQSWEMIDCLHKKQLSNVMAFCLNYESSKHPFDQYDYIVSNAALHWMNIPICLKKITSHLTQNGQCCLAIYGQNTSAELTHLLPLIGRDCVLPSASFLNQDELLKWGGIYFKDWLIQPVQVTVPFESVMDLLIHQKKTGVNVAVHNQGLWTKKTIQALEDQYQHHYGCVQLTYDIQLCLGYAK